MKELSKWLIRSQAFKNKERLPTILENKEVVIVNFLDPLKDESLRLRRTESKRDFSDDFRTEVRGRFIITKK